MNFLVQQEAMQLKQHQNVNPTLLSKNPPFENTFLEKEIDKPEWDWWTGDFMPFWTNHGVGVDAPDVWYIRVNILPKNHPGTVENK